MQLRGNHRAVRRAGIGLLALGALAGPGTAEAKVFVSPFTDAKGDAPAARDITKVRVAYNRKTGALSATVTVAKDYADREDVSAVFVGVSDLVNGRCRQGKLTLMASTADPAVPFAWVGNYDERKVKAGTGFIDGTTLKMRVKAKQFSGLTPGCAIAGILTTDDDPTPLDLTDENNGFR